MKPIYSNSFIISKNSDNTEVVICFNHQYINTENPNGEPIQENVSSIVLNRENAYELQSLLNNMLNNDVMI